MIQDKGLEGKQFNRPRIVDASGRLAPRDDRCPKCRAPKNERVNTTGFGAGDAVIVCQKCGHEFKGETEC